MSEYKIDRKQLLETVANVLEDQEYTQAMWEGGAAGFDRVDEWSDADVHVIVKDGSVEQAYADAEAAILALTEIDYRYRLPEPTWHGHSQCFYRFKDASPFLLLDLVFMQENSEAERFLQFRTHGKAKVWFDKAGLVVEEPLDEAEMLEKMKAAVEADRMRFDLFWVMIEKEIRRGNAIEAFNFYFSSALRPLHEVLRIIHSPARYFYTRYPQYDLPLEITDRLTGFYYLRDLEALEDKFAEARAWFAELIAKLDWEEIAARLAAS
jgi:hypothetical protein